MARERKQSVNGTGADFTQSGREMTVEPTPLWDNQHTVIGFIPMIKCRNAYGNMTMVAPALIELVDYYNGSLDQDTMCEWGLDTPEGAMHMWEGSGVVSALPGVTTTDNYIAGTILEHGFMRSLAKIWEDTDEITYREVDAGESNADDAWVAGEYDMEDLADEGLPEGETWMEA